MENKFKSTAEVAQQLGWDEMEFKGFKFGEESLKMVHESVKEILEDPEEHIKEIAEGFSRIVPLTVAFNIIGNGLVDYTTSRKQTKAQINKSFAIMAEEVKELKAAMVAQDKIEILDALADIIVVALGIAAKEGVLAALPGAFALVSHNNLTKFKFDEEVQAFYADVQNGKIQKPEGFQNVDLTIFDMSGAHDLEKEVENA